MIQRGDWKAFRNPAFAGLPPAEKEKFFQYIASGDPDYEDLPEEEKAKVKAHYLGQIIPEAKESAGPVKTFLGHMTGSAWQGLKEAVQSAGALNSLPTVLAEKGLHAAGVNVTVPRLPYEVSKRLGEGIDWIRQQEEGVTGFPTTEELQAPGVLEALRTPTQLPAALGKAVVESWPYMLLPEVKAATTLGKVGVKAGEALAFGGASALETGLEGGTPGQVAEAGVGTTAGVGALMALSALGRRIFKLGVEKGMPVADARNLAAQAMDEAKPLRLDEIKQKLADVDAALKQSEEPALRTAGRLSEMRARTAKGEEVKLPLPGVLPERTEETVKAPIPGEEPAPIADKSVLLRRVRNLVFQREMRSGVNVPTALSRADAATANADALSAEGVSQVIRQLEDAAGPGRQINVRALTAAVKPTIDQQARMRKIFKQTINEGGTVRQATDAARSVLTELPKEAETWAGELEQRAPVETAGRILKAPAELEAALKESALQEVGRMVYKRLLAQRISSDAALHEANRVMEEAKGLSLDQLQEILSSPATEFAWQQPLEILGKDVLQREQWKRFYEGRGKQKYRAGGPPGGFGLDVPMNRVFGEAPAPPPVPGAAPRPKKVVKPVEPSVVPAPGSKPVNYGTNPLERPTVSTSEQATAMKAALYGAGGKTSGKPAGKGEAYSPLNLDRQELPEEVKAMESRMMEAAPKTIEKAKGHVPMAVSRGYGLALTETDVKRAAAAGVTSAQLRSAAAEFVTNSVNDLKGLSERFLAMPEAERGGMEQQLAVASANAMQRIALAARHGADASRALSIGRMLTAPKSNTEKALALAYKKGITDPHFLVKLAAIPENDPGSMKRMLVSQIRPELADYVQEFIINGLMSAIQTPERNILGTVGLRSTEGIERELAGMLDAFRSQVKGTPREYFMGDVLTGLKGIKKAFQTRGTSATQLAKMPQFDPTGVFPQALVMAARAWKELDLGEWHRVERGPVKAFPGLFGRILRLPSTFNAVADRAAEAVFTSQEILVGARQKVLREAALAGEKLTRKEASARAQTILDTIEDHPEILEQAKFRGQYSTLQEPLGPAAMAFHKWLIHHKLLRIPIAPFYGTPIRLIKRGLERTPLGFAYTASKAASGEVRGGELSQQLARNVLGTIAAFAVYNFAKRGFVTGSGPENPDVRRNKMETGWRPYALKFGADYHPYRGFEPFSTILMLSAGAAQASGKEKEEQLKALVNTAIDSLVDKTFLVGFENLALAIADFQRSGKKWSQTTTGMVVPSIFGAAARALDPILRETRGPMLGVPNALKAKIPGLSETLPPKTSITGEVITREGTPLERFVSPSVGSPEKAAPLEREFDRLGWVPSKPEHRLVLHPAKQKVDLTDAEYSLFDEAHRRAAARARKLIATDAYRRLPDSGFERVTKQKVLAALYDQERRLVRDQIIANRLRSRRRAS